MSICEIENGENPQYCSNCGWEFVYFLSKPNETELKIYRLEVENAKLKYENKQLKAKKDLDDISEILKWSDEFGLGLLTAAGIGIGIHAAISATAGKTQE